MARVAQTGGRIVRGGLIDTIIVVQGDDANLVDRLYAAGAWAVVDPAAWGGCLTARPAPKNSRVAQATMHWGGGKHAEFQS